MGLRFRKSVNFGGFRVNFSKTGVGYSFGVKGARYTKTATGRKRTTLSIPGTGISWVEESGGKKTQSNTNTVPNATLLTTVENANADEFAPVEFDSFLNAIERCLNIRRFLFWCKVILFVMMYVLFCKGMISQGCTVLVFFACVFLVSVIFKMFFRVKVHYELNDEVNSRIDLITNLMTILKGNIKVWQLNEIYAAHNKKTNAGAALNNSISPISIKNKKPFFLKTNVNCFYVKLKKERIYILPDKILILNKNKIGAIDISKIIVTVDSINFITDVAPRDSKVINYTWQYVNNNGSPDKRFKNNRQLPVCLYGRISFKSEDGFNTIIYCSNIEKAKEFHSALNNKK